MGLLNRLKGLFGISFGTPGASTWKYAQDWVAGLPVGDGSSVTAPYAQHGVVGLAISVIAEDAAAVEWEVYPVGDDETELEDHPLLDLWARPNPYMVGSDLFVATYTYYRLMGEAWWYHPGLMIGSSSGPRALRRSTGELYVLNPQDVVVKVNGAGQRQYSLRDAAGTEQVLDSSSLTNFRRFNPYDQVRGLSMLSGVALEIDSDYAASSWNRNLLGERDGVPTGVLKPKPESIIAADEREAFEQRWNQRYGGRRKGIGVLPPGWDWQQLATSLKDMDYRGLREHAREQILANAGPLPPFLAGVLDKANYANAREQKDVYWNGTITRMLSYFQQAINKDFLPKVGLSDVEVYPCWEKVKSLTENLQEKMTVAQAMFGMGFTKRQINERLELGIDVDELEDADVGYLPFSVAPVSMVLEPPEPAPAPVQDEPGNGEPQRAYKGSLLHMNEQRRAMVWRSVISRARDIEAKFNSMIRSHFRGIEKEALASVEGAKGWLMWMEKGNDPIFDVKAAKRRLMEDSEPLHKAAIKRGGESVIADMDVDVDFDVTNPRVISRLAEMTGLITRIDDTVERLLRDSLTEGLASGESPQQLAKRVRDVMDVSKSRSMTIARTETGKAFSTGRYEGMAQAGVERHEWISARDDKVRDSHGPPPTGPDGVVVRVGEAFPGTNLLFPNDPSGPPEEVINCRCVAVPVVGEV